MQDRLLATALAYAKAGCSVVPVSTDGGKLPAVAWKAYQTTRPDDMQLARWFTSGAYDGLGIICGTVSGNLELLELEGRALGEGLLPQLEDALTAHGLADLWTRLNHGHRELTPSGGLHWLYRVDGAPRRNLKLARRPATDTELADNPHDRVKVLIETRGEGGFTIIAPSAGRTHPTGGAWILVTGDPTTIPVISEDERDALHAVAALLDQMPADEPLPPAQHRTGPGGGESTRPGDDYNQRATWDELLGAHGWTKVRKLGAGWAWRRPGKTTGISATTGQSDSGDRLYVFSSSTEFTTEKPYSKFAAYTLLEHAGDYKAAAKALAAAGYGAQEPTRTVDDLTGLVAPHQRPTLTVVPGGAGTSYDGNTALAPQPIRITLTDQGNAELLVGRHAHRLRYVPARGAWLEWSGTRWAWSDDDGPAIQATIDTIHALPTSSDAEHKHVLKSLSRRGLEAAVALARRDHRIRVPISELDAHPYALNTPSGVVDLRDGTTRPSTPDQLHTALTTAPYDATADAPRWRQFLTDTFGDDTDVIGFVQRLAGYSACGVVLHHVLPFLHGSGGNGKSVFLDVLVAVLGDYASTAPSGFLMAGGRDDENAVARLAGLRFVVCSEVNQTARFDEAKVKLLTGGDRLTARFLYQRHFTFVPSHTLWLMGNHQPRVDAGGESFWRRLRLLPFNRVVPPEQRVEGLADLLVADEAPGILRWIVDGARDALAGGLSEPSSVLTATKQYAEEEDALARFITDRCQIGGGNLVKLDTAQLRKAYSQWCHDEGEREVSPQVLGRELRTRFGITTTRANGRRYYIGLALLNDETEPAEQWWQR